MNILSLLLGNIFNPEISYNDDTKLERYIKSLPIKTDFVKVEGPFLNERYALKYLDLYKDLLCKSYYKINVIINRKIALISSDESFSTKDNSRVDLNITPLNHKFELFVRSKNNFVVVGVDGELLLNKDDSDRI